MTDALPEFTVYVHQGRTSMYNATKECELKDQTEETGFFVNEIPLPKLINEWTCFQGTLPQYFEGRIEEYYCSIQIIKKNMS